MARWQRDLYHVGDDPYSRVSSEASKQLLDNTHTVEPRGITEVLAVDADQLDTHGGPRTILGVLLLQGVITREQIRAAEDALDASEDLYDAI